MDAVTPAATSARRSRPRSTAVRLRGPEARGSRPEAASVPQAAEAGPARARRYHPKRSMRPGMRSANCERRAGPVTVTRAPAALRPARAPRTSQAALRGALRRDGAGGSHARAWPGDADPRPGHRLAVFLPDPEPPLGLTADVLEALPGDVADVVLDVGLFEPPKLGDERLHAARLRSDLRIDHASSARRSSTVSRRRMTRASPSATSTAAGRGTAL